MYIWGMVCVKIKENSFISKVAYILAGFKKSDSVATTIGKTIHLHNVTAKGFIHNNTFLRHELQHAIQFTTIKFFWLKYLLETIKNGYSKNKYELEAERLSDTKFPYDYLVYSDTVLTMRNNEFLAQFGKYDPVLPEINRVLKLNF